MKAMLEGRDSELPPGGKGFEDWIKNGYKSDSSKLTATTAFSNAAVNDDHTGK